VLFAAAMWNKKIYSFGVFGILVLLSLIFSESKEEPIDFSEKVKISLRAVGNDLLLAHNDSTSLVLPVVEIAPNTYRLSFQNDLGFEPGQLIAAVTASFKKSSLPEFYRVEVIQCSDKEVAHSYQMSATKETTIIPCGQRKLPESCYIIEVKFTTIEASFFGQYGLGLIIVFSVFIFVLLLLSNRKKKLATAALKEEGSFATLGSFKFYPEQNKLVKEAVEIGLSKKECELLALFIENPNQIIKRDELTKRVWEDNGVIVGRSLDTYISKLRKKLQGDDSLKLTNVHGVGYKLEIHP